MPIDAVDEFPVVCRSLSVDTMRNFIKSIDQRLLEPIPDVSISISFNNECELQILYTYKGYGYDDLTKYEITVCVSSTYVIIYGNNGAIMMYDGDGEELGVKERVFSTVMDILNRFKS